MEQTPRRPAPIPRGRRAIAPAPRAGRAVADVLAGFQKQFGAGMGEITSRWAEIVGEKTAGMCTPVKLTGRGAHGTLHVAAAGPAALLVEANAARILDQVNAFCGRDVAKRIAITRASARPAAPAASGRSGARPAARPGARPQTSRRSAPSLPPSADLKLEAGLEGIDDPRLRAALMKLGRAALSEAAARTRS